MTKFDQQIKADARQSRSEYIIELFLKINSRKTSRCANNILNNKKHSAKDETKYAENFIISKNY